MAHWAQIDENNIVVSITVGNNEEPDEGYQWLVDNLGGTWIKTSYNGNIRKNFAGIGFEYRPDLDAFISPQPYLSWVLDEDAQWQAPTPYPSGDGIYQWVEDDLNWQLVEGV